jgi:uncharacterized protein (DUF1800 family)
MDERDAVVWLHRRAGFGLSGEQLRAALERGAAAELDRLLDPAGAGGAPAVDPWEDSKLPVEPKDREARDYAVTQWLDLMVSTEQPVVDRITWFWHGHFVSAFDKVRIARMMVDQIRLFRAAGLGGFGDLLRAVTIDPAMMIYLDLGGSTGAEPNENYAREVLELFTLGVGNYTEADVKAGALALTGWRAKKGERARLVAAKHDDTPQTFLGMTGVHDLDTVINAIVASKAMPRFVASKLAVELLGISGDTALVARLATAFTDSGLDVRELVRATLREGLAGNSQPIVLGPVPWLIAAQRVTGATLKAKDRARLLGVAGQHPMMPPNVGGWPGGTTWFGASGLVARSNLAALVATGTPDGAEVLAAAQGDDTAALAVGLGLPSDGFSAESSAALLAAPAGRDRLALALVSPEFLIA